MVHLINYLNDSTDSLPDSPTYYIGGGKVGSSGNHISASSLFMYFGSIGIIGKALYLLAKHAGALAINPTAIAAEPIKSPINEISSLS
jgi:hypothetical protein